MKWSVLIIVCIIIGVGFWYIQSDISIEASNVHIITNQNADELPPDNAGTTPVADDTATRTANTNTALEATDAESTSSYFPPLDRPTDRITKKPYGIYITSATSPVQPERFSGYHTAVDLEAFPHEEEADVMVRAFCSGPILTIRTVNGYGGVIVQQCEVDNQTITALYGHININSVIPSVGDTAKPGDELALLGAGYSSETDGERKHLHFALHKGATIEYRGYVSSESALADWIDPALYL